MTSPEMILSIVTALAFTGAGVANAFDLGGTAESFREWGYPQGWRFITAFMEIAGAAMILEPRMQEVGLALLGAVIIGAVLTLLRVRAGWRHLAPAIGFGLLLIADGASVAWSI